MTIPSAILSDRRYVPRIRQNIPAKIEFLDAQKKTLSLCQGRLIALNSHGFTLHFSALSEEVPPLIDIEFPIAETGIFHATCRVQSQRTNSDSSRILGLKILSFKEGHKILLDRFIGQQGIDRAQLLDRRTTVSVRSELFEIRKSPDGVIRGIKDKAVKTPSQKLSVIIAPAFGETKSDAIPLSYFLALNGFCCYRFDATNHVGESSGSILDCTLSNLETDVRAVLNYLTAKGEANIALVASGVTARACMKMLDEKSGLRHVTLIDPVVNLEATLKQVYSENVLEMPDLENAQIVDLLGYPISISQFISDVKEQQFDHLCNTKQQLSEVTVPLHWVAFQSDSRVVFSESSAAFDSIQSKEKLLSAYSADVQITGFSNLPSIVISDVSKRIIASVNESAPEDLILLEPNLREMALQRSLERERLRTITSTNQNHSAVEFWGRYLERFHFIIRVPEYRSVYENIFSLLGDIQPGDRLLDAGCGNGSLGLWLLLQERFRGAIFSKDLLYVGIDLVPQAITQAMQSHKELLLQLEHNNIKPQISFSYNVGDLSVPLPYADNSFEHISSNLVLSYLQDPFSAFAELYRVLKPKGRLVVTSIRPNPDFSQIYRTTLKYCQTPEERKGCRRLLNNVAGIVEKEKQGIFRFFDKSELINMAERLKGSRPEIISSFGNQAYALMIEKS